MEKYVNKELVKYIKDKIIPVYKLNGKAHGAEHIEMVKKRATEISELYPGLNYNILYTAVTFHDIGDHIDRKNHEIISANIMMEDKNLDKFFSKDEKEIIKQAIEDHRSSKGKVPRNIYGRILASADKCLDINKYFERCISYEKEHHPEYTKQQILNRNLEHAIEKFGKNGYAINMYYVNDNKYNEYLKKLQKLIDNEEEFFKKSNEIYDKLNKVN